MIAGHYATALVPRHYLRDVPFWLFLVCAQLADFLWLIFALVGLEPTAPTSILDGTIQGMHVDMLYSHNVVPTLVLAAGVGLAVYAWRHEGVTAVCCGLLVVVHFLCDLLCGYQHEFLGPDSPRVGLDLYLRAPELALVIEAVFGGVLVAWYAAAEKKVGRPLTTRQIAILCAVFCGGTLAWLPTATTPLRAWFSH